MKGGKRGRVPTNMPALPRNPEPKKFHASYD